ncbi:cell surface protein SprA, partial [bacterium]|nr:cell surface protein SprA [bacterium]
TTVRTTEGVLELPFLRPFDPHEGEANVKLADADRCEFYDEINSTQIQQQSKFYLEVKAAGTRSTTYQLGFNVIDGSEQVYFNNQLLSKGTDYIIDYITGTMTILREGADDASANIKITYQRNQFFQLEKRTLMGTNLKYKLWNEDSFLGGTFMYLNESTLDQKVRVGEGPKQNMVWDLNTKMTLKPAFLTKVVDALPLIRTKAESRLNFEAEIAQSIPNPNTLNNSSTGDNDGVAYIDDFESVKRETPLGVTRRSWYPASCPADSNLTDLAESRASKKGKLFWYNPEYQVYIKDIWPNQDINGNVAQRVNVLNLDFDPSSALESGDLTTNWGGVMRPLSAGYANQTESKFIEIMLKCPQLKGQLHIDMGQVSEDMIPNYSESFDMYFPTLNTEDRRVDGYSNKLLDDGEDTGLDMMAGTDGEDWWDLNGDGIRQENMEPLSNDDWNYSQGSNSYANINGTENSARDYGARVPDTEDINNNSTLDTQNDYFEYRMNLDPAVDKQTKQYVQGGDLEGLSTGWRLYRIPLEDFYKKEGEPRFDLIEFVRIWINGVDEPVQIQIAEINIVGNMWLEGGVYIPVDTLSADSLSYEYDFFPNNTDTVITTVVNTHDNSEEYHPQETGVSGVIDKVSQVEAREQSLVLRINNDLPPQAEGIAQKTLVSSLNFNNYNRIKMFAHGGNGKAGSELNFPNGQLEYFVRFGLNSSNYYEYRTNIFFGWDTRNHMDIDLGKLSSMKENISTVKYLTINSTQMYEVKEDTVWVDEEFYYILRVVNNPSLSNIKQMTIGVKNCTGNTLTLEPGMEPVEVWFNEFRLSEVKKEKGLALRASLDLGLADVFSGNVQITQQSADFIRISDRFGNGSNKLSSSYSGTMRFGKFFPSQWGISIPVNFNYSVSEGAPKYLAGSDILYDDLEDQARKDAEVNYSQSEGWGISFKKTTRSKKFIVKNTLDKLSLNYSNSKSNSHNASTKKRTSEMHKAGVNYRLDFGRNNYTKPFSFLKKAPLLGGLGGLKLYYTPSNVSVGISGSHNKNFSETRPSDDPLGEGNITNTRKINLSRNLQASYKIMESLKLSYTQTLRNDFANAQEADSTLEIEDILKGQFGTKTAHTQAFTTKFNPKLAKWFTMNLSYGANFNWANQIQSGDLGRSTTSKNTYSANVNFNPSQMFRSVFKIKPASKRSSSRNRSQRRMPGQKEEQPDGDGAPKKKRDEGPGFAMRGLSWFTGVWQPITATYTRSDNTSLRAIEDKFPSTAFQFFALADPGVMMVDSSQVRSNSYAFTQNYSLGTGIKPTRNMSLTFKYNFREGRNETSQITGNYQQSAFDGLPFPTWQFRWTGIEKIWFFKKFANRISLDHKYTGSFTEKWTDSPANVTSQVISNKYNPVIGLNLTLKKNISVSLSYNMDETTNNSLGLTNSGSRTENSNFALKASYNKRGGMKLNVWPFKNKELKNTVDMSLKISATSNKSFAKPEGKWVVRDASSKIEFKPQVRYSFSSLVTGGTYLTISQQKNKRIGNTAIQEFGLDVNISIRGN